METDYGEDLRLALDVARRADEISTRWFRAENLEVEVKDDLTPTTGADRAVEEMTRRILRARRPHDAIVGEELGDSGHADRRWIVDPIDGTKNFVDGNPVYATLLALEDRGDLVVAVASAPKIGRRWWATRGGGAWCNGVRIHVSEVRSPSHASVSFGSLHDWLRAGELDHLVHLVGNCRRDRAFGDFWQHVLVAEGAVDISIERADLDVWDIAAPKLIVEEAGGRATSLSGSQNCDGSGWLSTNGLLHQQVLDIVAGMV